jgi:hypothetical protein
MRTLISIIAAVCIFIFVAILVNSGNVVLPDYWTALAVGLTIAALTVLVWGQKPRIMKFIMEKKTSQEDKAVTKPSSSKVDELTSQSEKEIEREMVREHEKEIHKKTVKKGEKKTVLLVPNEIIKLKIDNNLLNKLYQQAHDQAINIQSDAKLSHLTIHVYPFQQVGSNVTIYFDFYSKIADKTSDFKFDEFSSKIEHTPPLRHIKHAFQRIVLDDLPWIISPHWIQFLERAYSIIRPLHEAIGSSYYLGANGIDEWIWVAIFKDEVMGKERTFRWKGTTFDEKSFKEEILV